MAEEERQDYYIPPTLGELNTALGAERGELQAYDLEGRRVPPGAPGGVTQVADLGRQTGIVDTTERMAISPRPPALLYQVVSTYDSRPIQAYDFQSSLCSAIEFFQSGPSATFNPVSITYTVPDNTVAILRKFRYTVQFAPVNHVQEGDCWLQSDLFVNDLPVREYNQMTLPVVMERPKDAFVIVDERKRIRFTLSDAGAVLASGIDGISSPVLFELYGNLLLKTGVPVEFEIANPIGGGQL